MKVSSKILAGVTLGILLIPTVSYAAWWKPYTWFKKPAISTQAVQVSTTTLPTKPAASIPAPVAKKERPAAAMKPVAPPPAKITDQSSEIDKLKTEVAELKKQQSQQTAQTEKASPPPVPVVNTPPPNTIACNGTNWTQCPAGQDFVCPASGNAYCRLPQSQSQQPDYATLLDNLLQSIIESERASYQKYLEQQRQIDEEARPLYDELGQKRKEWKERCINPDGSMPFLVGQRASECDKLSLDQRLLQNKINSITGFHGDIDLLTKSAPPPRENWTIERYPGVNMGKIYSSSPGATPYFYRCNEFGCKIYSQ